LTGAYLLLLGSELLDFKREDKNGKLVIEFLKGRNISLRGFQILEDDEELISEAFRFAISQSDIVISSGGIGPTGDDLTREALAGALSVPLVPDACWLGEIEKRLALRQKSVTEHDRKMALIPLGSKAIFNHNGLAAGVFSTIGDKKVFLLPGVPSEFKSMLETFVIKEIDRTHKIEEMSCLRFTLAGIREAEVQKFLSTCDDKAGIKYSILPHHGFLEVSFTIETEKAGDGIGGEIGRGFSSAFKENLISTAGEGIVQVLAEKLGEKKFTLSVAESLTGGFISQKIVSLSGASSFFKGGVTAYSNEAKTGLLGVPEELVEKYGAVSEQVALAMARGARARFLTSCAIATTGIAGPTGATPEKPVGLVYIAVSKPHKEEVHRFVFPLDRMGVIEMASNYALFHFLKLLRNEN
jgi:nicotinamide-nucleotide amidase